MEETASSAIIALVLAALPVVAVGLVIVVVFVALALLAGLVALLEKPPRYWLLAIMVVFNAIVLIPVWLASKFVSATDPEAWAQAEGHVLTFSIVFLLPTIVWAAYCELKTWWERRALSIQEEKRLSKLRDNH